MRLSAVREGDLVLADVRGRQFLAHVDGPPCGGRVSITPLGQDTFRELTARQVVSHYQRRGGAPEQLRYIVGGARRRATISTRRAGTGASA